MPDSRIPRRHARGDDAQARAYTGPSGELIVNLGTKTVHVHDGVTPGGTPLLRAEDADVRRVLSMSANTLMGRLSTSGAPQNITSSQVLQLLGFSLTDLAPTGSITDWAFTAAPSGWLIMAGQLLNRTTYPRLWTLVQSSARLATEAAWQAGDFGTFSLGDGSTTFRLPDPRGIFIRVFDGGRGVDSNRILASSQSHAIQDHRHAHPPQGGFVTNSYPTSVPWAHNGSSGSLNMNGGDDTGAMSSGNIANETRPINIAWNKIIKYA